MRRFTAPLAPMSPTNHRHERVGEEIAHEINAMLAGELKDPRLEGMVVVSEVRVQPDMKHARVYVHVRGTNKEQSDAIKALDHASGYIRSELIERLAAPAIAGLALYARPLAGTRRAHRTALERSEERQASSAVADRQQMSRRWALVRRSDSFASILLFQSEKPHKENSHACHDSRVLRRLTARW